MIRFGWRVVQWLYRSAAHWSPGRSPLPDTQCVASAFQTEEGWGYSCLCGYESRPDMLERVAKLAARVHEAA